LPVMRARADPKLRRHARRRHLAAAQHRAVRMSLPPPPG
jgi:hypothetical protein